MANQSDRILPTLGAVSLERTALSIAAAPSEVGCPDRAIVRTVAYQTGNRWVPFAQSLRVGEDDDAARDSVEVLGSVNLVTTVHKASALGSSDDLRKARAAWHRLVDGAHEFGGYQEPANIMRETTLLQLRPSPFWRVTFAEVKSNT